MKLFNKTILAIAIAAVALGTTGCSTLPDDYQFGDGTRAAIKTVNSIVQLKNDYCNTTDPAAKAAILLTIKSLDPTYTGLCAP